MDSRTISHYRLIRPLGSGGMGTVHVAEDIQLGRLVALKLLSGELSGDQKALMRFRFEARLASSLNHPNICTIYEFGNVGGQFFIAMELVEGEPLRELIAGKALPTDQIVNIAIQIADALTNAHGKGVIHRDITPSNIVVNHGLVKVLDFGLAKTFGPKNTNGESGIPKTKPADLTSAGELIGTLAYMSPEQVLGKELDGRTDLFSTGVVLYQMATGRLPFTGTTTGALFNQIVNQNPPPPKSLNPALPSILCNVIETALAKNPDKRYSSASELLSELRLVQEATTPTRKLLWPLVLKGTRKSRWIAFAGAALLATSLSAVFLIRSRPKSVPANTAVLTQITSLPGAELSPAISPDGKLFAFVKDGDIFVQRVAGQRSLNITNAPQFKNDTPAFSPDSSRIVFRSERDGGGIFVVGATGESVTRLTDAGYDPAWSPDGSKIVFTTRHEVDPNNLGTTQGKAWILDFASGEKRELPLDDVLQPRWSPHGQRIAYWKMRRDGLPATARDIWTARVDGSDAKPVTSDSAIDWDPIWSPDGSYLYYSSDHSGNMNLWRVPIDETTGQTRGSPEAVTTGGTAWRHSPTLSSDGRNILYVEQLEGANIYKTAFDPVSEKLAGSPEPVTRGNQLASMPAPSPDGQWVAFWLGGKQEDIALMRPDGSDFRKLTDDAYKDRYPRWSPDGKEISFYSDRSGNYEVWAIRPDGSGLRAITHTGARAAHMAWAPGRSELVYSETSNRLMSIDPHKAWSEQTPQPVAQDMVGSQPIWSPDGWQLLCLGRLVSNVSEGILRYDRKTKTVSKILDFGFGVKWLNDSERILVSTPDAIHLFNLRTKKQRELMKVPLDSFATFDVSADGRTIYYSQRLSEADIWLISVK